MLNCFYQFKFYLPLRRENNRNVSGSNDKYQFHLGGKNSNNCIKWVEDGQPSRQVMIWTLYLHNLDIPSVFSVVIRYSQFLNEQ